MQLVPGGLGEEALQVALGLGDVFAIRQLPALGQAVDVGVHGKGGDTERLCHHHLGRFVADSGKSLEGIEITRHLTAMLVDQDLGEFLDRFGFLRAEAAGFDDGFNLCHRLRGQGLRCPAEFSKQARRDLIHPHIGALG